MPSLLCANYYMCYCTIGISCASHWHYLYNAQCHHPKILSIQLDNFGSDALVTDAMLVPLEHLEDCSRIMLWNWSGGVMGIDIRNSRWFLGIHYFGRFLDPVDLFILDFPSKSSIDPWPTMPPWSTIPLWGSYLWPGVLLVWVL